MNEEKSRFDKVIYSKDSMPEEYQENGHYVIDGADYMSLWAFKNNFVKDAFADKNKDTATILKKRFDYEISKPDLGD